MFLTLHVLHTTNTEIQIWKSLHVVLINWVKCNIILFYYYNCVDSFYALYNVLTSQCFDVIITSSTVCLYNVAYLTSRDWRHNVLVYFVFKSTEEPGGAKALWIGVAWVLDLFFVFIHPRYQEKGLIECIYIYIWY